MPNLNLSYFDFNGGWGDSIGLAPEIGEIRFEDHQIPVTDWPTVRETTPFHCVPVLEVDGREFSQSNAINRYVGTLARLYPADPLRALHCDEVLDARDLARHAERMQALAAVAANYGVG
ncbi:MAG: hypothetical protein P8R42_16100 [Candidatus Binatia bacterium]|nr:hypothetical protein [Candidatus Binatia bacterium]